MFFIMGIGPREKQLAYNKLVVCADCGQYSRYEIWMTCTCFSAFFIPLFKWDKHYLVRSVCCGTTYELLPEIGKMIEKGQDVEILPEHLTKISGGTHRNAYGRTCRHCGYMTTEDFQYCPKCGQPLN